jgi:cytoskeletal protein CcmA (bactofilin family)
MLGPHRGGSIMFSREKTSGGRPGRSGAAGLSFIGPEVVVSGDLATDSQLHLDGRIDGNVRCQQLIQGEAGSIAGNIQAEEARIAGTVDGQVNVGTLVVEATAKIMGDIVYETISIAGGAQLEGRLARRAALGADEAPLIATPVSFSPAKSGKAAKTTGTEQTDIFIKSA